ncbi:MalY/PatB family protein [Lacticaseibacillus daqingensis]|uniref:MalY/PatB family protein n=1 Tax=Lacticaseibacillus daqingensis TaxID=2486014 RepID=UPI000F79EB7D|nr:aminotransferase class I/II-fold pyridoxal phosphate-dependent enzyme [Lacticaseibacillus daqingensis]
MDKIDFDTVVDRYGTYSTQWDYVQDRFGQADLLPFTISDMDFKAPSSVGTVLRTAAERGVFGYTRWNHADFKGAIQNWFLQRYAATIAQDWVVYSPSVIFSLAKLVDQFSRPGAKVVTLSPCYDAFIATIEANDRQLIQLDISAGFTLEALEAVFAREHPAVFVLCNPHNPLGIAWTHAQLQGMVTLCNAYHVAIISDEIHLDILRAGVQPHTLAAYFNRLTVPCAVLSSASKAFNIPALGCSYGLIPDERQRLEFLYTLKQRNALSSVPYLGMLATMTCYNHEAAWLDQLNAYLDANFTFMTQFLATRLNYAYTVPHATYLAWLDIRPLGVDMAALQAELVDHQQVAIMDGRVYGKGGANHLRFNLGAPRTKVVDGLNRLRRAVDQLTQEK